MYYVYQIRFTVTTNTLQLTCGATLFRNCFHSLSRRERTLVSNQTSIDIYCDKIFSDTRIRPIFFGWERRLMTLYAQKIWSCACTPISTYCFQKLPRNHNIVTMPRAAVQKLYMMSKLPCIK